MASLLTALQFYPALNKMLSDLSGFWTGVDPMARERISQHKIDEMKQQLSDMKTLIERSYNKSVDAGTQTDPECPVSNVCYPSCSPQIGTPSSYTCRYITTAPETPREWGGIVTGMSWTD